MKSPKFFTFFEPRLEDWTFFLPRFHLTDSELWHTKTQRLQLEAPTSHVAGPRVVRICDLRSKHIFSRLSTQVALELLSEHIAPWTTWAREQFPGQWCQVSSLIVFVQLIRWSWREPKYQNMIYDILFILLSIRLRSIIVICCSQLNIDNILVRSFQSTAPVAPIWQVARICSCNKSSDLECDFSETSRVNECRPHDPPVLASTRRHGSTWTERTPMPCQVSRSKLSNRHVKPSTRRFRVVSFSAPWELNRMQLLLHKPRGRAAPETQISLV